jgi:hypothetical protein
MSFQGEEITNEYRYTTIQYFPLCTVFRDKDNNLNLFITAKDGVLHTLEVNSNVLNFKNTQQRFPKELYKNSERSSFSQLVAANNKTELFLYGGQVNDEILDGIYKYSQVTKLWMKVGTMIFPRASHVVIPVQGLSCP